MASSDSQKLLDAWISRGIHADLIFYGEILGTKSGESPQLLKEYEYASDYLRLGFNTTEELYVYEPSECFENVDSDLCIKSATKLVFGWHSYGKPQSEQYWCTFTYEKIGDDDVRRTPTGVMREHLKRFGDPDKTFSSRGYPALWISPPKIGRWTGNL